MSIAHIVGTDFFSEAIAKMNAAIDAVNAMAAINGLDVTDPANLQILQYNGTSEKWENQTDYLCAGDVKVASGNKIMLDGTSGTTYIKFNSEVTPTRVELYISNNLIGYFNENGWVVV